LACPNKPLFGLIKHYTLTLFTCLVQSLSLSRKAFNQKALHGGLMTTDQTSSILWLWILQIAWWLAAMLPLAVAGILIALGLRALHRRARTIEKKPVSPEPGGYVNLLRDKFSHMAIGQSMLYLILGGLALGGMLGLLLQSFIQPEVQKAVKQGDLIRPEAAAPTSQGDPINFILFLALILGTLTVVIGIYAYHSLRQNATEAAAHLTGREPSRPYLVKWFHDSKKMGMLVMVIGGWICFGLLMQLVGLIVFIVPLPESLTNLSFQWATTDVIVVLVAAAVVLFLAPFVPAVWMGVRHFKLEVRYYRENPTFRLMTNIFATLGSGSFGALLFMNLLYRTGISPITGEWLDIFGPLWVIAYLLAYGAAILFQIQVCRTRERDFSLANIAVAFIVAFPVSVPVFFLLFLLLSHFLSQLFG
jgi:hypothetical protein